MSRPLRRLLRIPDLSFGQGRRREAVQLDGVFDPQPLERALQLAAPGEPLHFDLMDELGQLLMVLRAKFLVDAIGLNKVQGKPFKQQEIEDKIEEVLQ